MTEMDELVKEFLVESYDNLDQLDRDFIALEQDPNDVDTLAGIFRCIHTIKGTCGFLGFQKLEKVTHVGENLLSKLRDGELSLTPEMTNALLELVDAVREILGNIEQRGEEGEGDYTTLVETLTEHLEGGGADSAGFDAAVSAEAPAREEALEEEERPAWMASPEVIAEAEAMFAESEDASAAKPDSDAAVAAEPVAARPEVEPAPAEAAIPAPSEDSATPPSPPSAGSGSEEDGALDKRDASQGSSLTDSTIRVDVMLLDKLMNLVGELVLSRNQILQVAVDNEDPNFVAASQRLNLITSELQEGVMKTRMQPIGNVWSKFPRVVRDLSRAIDKEIRLEMEGKDTELDKTLLEAIKDPLTHIVRNSVDHGIETPEEREAKGKPREGLLLLRAYHEGGQVIIEIVDDGGGIDPQRIKAKAIEKGVVSQKEADRMGDRELLNLIWAPGFSTAKEVTNISGRGVGMDVVRTNIEKIGGSLDLHSEVDSGTTLRVKIPLTLAIIPALVITCRGERYAIPQVNLVELVRLEMDNGDSGIEHIHGTPVYRLRGNLLPLVYLREQLFGTGEDGMAGDVNNGSHATRALNNGSENGQAVPEASSVEDETTEEPDEDALVGPIQQGVNMPEAEDDAMNIVVLQAEDRQFGLVVDGVHDTEEIVVKPLGKQLKELAVFAGATIMGDGKVTLILDTMGIAHRAGVVIEGSDSSRMETDHDESEASGERMNLLLFRMGEAGRVAIPLDVVSRLEEFNDDAIEKAGGMEVVQYRGDILPLIRVSKVLEERREQPRAIPEAVAAKDEEVQAQGSERMTQVVVYTKNERSVGFIVDQILDISEEAITSRGRASRPGVAFTAVVQGQVTEFLDLDVIIGQTIPDLLDEPALVPSGD